jgi:hypothetical protein
LRAVDFLDAVFFFEAVFFEAVLFLVAVFLLEDDFFEAVFFFVADFLLEVDFFEADFFDEDFLDGTFSPRSLASDNPIAIACLRLVTFLPERPLFNVPCLRSCIAFSTLFCAPLEYLRGIIVKFNG